MNAAELYTMTVSERRRLAALLADLSAEQWAAASLCDGWRIREVVAHLNTSETQTWPEFQAAVAAAGGDINVACDRTARADTARFSDPELLSIYQERVPSRWTPGPDAHQGALAHEVIHGLDITTALGLPGPEPRVAAAALDGGSPESIAFFGVDLAGIALVAEDADLRVGSDPASEEVEIALPAVDLVLVATGRAPVPARPSEVA